MKTTETRPEQRADDTSLAAHGALRDIPVGVKKSKEAYERDLPLLLRRLEFQRRWVAYAGDERIGIGATETALYQECQKGGLRPDEVYIGMVVPFPVELETVDPSGYEFTEHLSQRMNLPANLISSPLEMPSETV